MIIACPECKTRYIVAPQAIGKDGRLVKCSKCEHTWFQEAPEEDAEIVPETVIKSDEEPARKSPSDKDESMKKMDPGTKPESPMKKNVPALVKERSPAVVVGWVVLAVIVLAGSFSLYYFRADLEDRYDVAETLYGKWDYLVLGKRPAPPEKPDPVVEVVPHPATKVSMRQAMEIRMENDFPSLVITLDVQNDNEQEVVLPRFTGYLRDAEGNEVFSWPQVLDPSTIPAGGFQQYEIIVDKIPAEATEAELIFEWED